MKKKLLLFTAAALLLCVLTGLCLHAADVRSLQRDLLGLWRRDIQARETTHLELLITEREMEYEFCSTEFPEMNELLDTYSYRVLSRDKLRITYSSGMKKTVTVSVVEDTLTLTPAITAEWDKEVWTRP